MVVPFSHDNIQLFCNNKRLIISLPKAHNFFQQQHIRKQPTMVVPFIPGIGIVVKKKYGMAAQHLFRALQEPRKQTWHAFQGHGRRQNNVSVLHGEEEREEGPAHLISQLIR